jgi:hypothetical protein
VRLGHPTYGVVDGEAPPRLHRLSVVAGRAYCGKSIEVLDRVAEGSMPLICRRCAAIDESRREGMPTFDEEIFY